jgi:hypothetical protein
MARIVLGLVAVIAFVIIGPVAGPVVVQPAGNCATCV